MAKKKKASSSGQQKKGPVSRPEYSVDHLWVQCRGGRGGPTKKILNQDHIDRHTIFAHLNFVEMPGQIAWMEGPGGTLNPKFMNEDFKAACDRYFGIGATGDEAWARILDIYSLDVVKTEIDRQLAGRSFADVIRSQLRKYALIYGEQIIDETIVALSNKVQPSGCKRPNRGRNV